MLNPWLVLGTVAFVASFGISLLMSRDLGGSLIAGSTALGTAYLTAAAVNRYHNRSSDRRLVTLRYQIRQLQQQRLDEEHALVALTAEKERVAESLNAMQVQLRQYQLPGTAAQAHRPMLSWDLSSESLDAVEVLPEEGYPPPMYPHPHDAYTEQRWAEATATKQHIAATINQLQAELGQLDGQITDHRYLRDQLVQEIQQLGQHKEQLGTEAIALRREVTELERCRIELEQYVNYVEAKKRELETGSSPLQKALQQLQGQIAALQTELHTLEQQVAAKRQEKAAVEREATGTKQQQKRVLALQDTLRELDERKTQLDQAIAAQTQRQEQQQAALEQAIAAWEEQQGQVQAIQEQVRSLTTQKVALEQDITALQAQQEHLTPLQATVQKLEHQIRDRRQEKDAIERQITQLQAEKTALRKQSTVSNGKNEPSAVASSPQILAVKPANGKSAPAHQAKAADPQNGSTKPALQRPKAPADFDDDEADDPEEANDLPDVWTELMVQMPDYEFQALRAIAEQKNPLQAIGQIAQENFMAVEELLESINHRARDIVGEPVLKIPTGFNPPSLVRSHTQTVQQLIETYEYLTH